MISTVFCDVNKLNGHLKLDIRVAILFSLLLHIIFFSLFVSLVREGGRSPNEAHGERRGEHSNGPLLVISLNKSLSNIRKDKLKLLSNNDFELPSDIFFVGGNVLPDPTGFGEVGENFGRLGVPIFYPQEMLDRPPVPVFAPAYKKYLADSGVSGGIFKIRLYIDGGGKVIKVEALTPIGSEYLAPFVSMFMGTAFIPGSLHGIDVPSFVDIEMDLVKFN